MNDLFSIQALLVTTGRILRYENELAQASGENFNVFNVLCADHYESTHSRVLAALLDPQSSHGRGATFLKLFINAIDIGNDEFYPENAFVRTEVDIRPYGRIDIYLKDRTGRCILIENKIHAGLQERQLQRYHEYIERYNPSAYLLYLTLKGDKPDEAACLPNLKSISYRKDILDWLESCRKEAATVPSLREVITQYIHLVQQLTRQNTSTRMKNELIQTILQNKDTYAAYTTLTTLMKAGLELNIKKQIISQLDIKIQKERPSGLEKLGGEDGWWFSTPELKQYNLGLNLEFEYPGYENFFFGFYRLNKDKEVPKIAELLAFFHQEFGMFTDERTTKESVSAYWKEYQNWNDDVFSEIQFGSLHKKIIQIIFRMKDVADKYIQSIQTSTDCLSNPE